MNFRSSFRSFLAFAAAAFVFAFASQAQAQTTSCNGCTTSAPSGFTVQIGLGAATEGTGFANWAGAAGAARVDKEGFSRVESTLNMAGNLCGPSCQQGNFTAAASAGELVQASGWATGQGARVTNGTSAASVIQFNFQKLGQ